MLYLKTLKTFCLLENVFFKSIDRFCVLEIVNTNFSNVLQYKTLQQFHTQNKTHKGAKKI